MTEQRTAYFEERVQAQAAKHGPYIAMKTLMGGQPDCNRRTIYNILTGEKLETYNQQMRDWTPEFEAALTDRLKVLNDAYLLQKAQA